MEPTTKSGLARDADGKPSVRAVNLVLDQVGCWLRSRRHTQRYTNSPENMAVEHVEEL